MASSVTFTVPVQFCLKEDRDHPALRLIGYPACELVTNGEDPFVLDVQLVTISEILYLGKRRTVYGGSCQDGTEIVLKFTGEDDIVAEAGVYDAHLQVQGQVIPRLYGVLYGDLTDGDDIVCLALERFGNHLERDFVELDVLEKCVLVIMIQQLFLIKSSPNVQCEDSKQAGRSPSCRYATA